MTANEEIRELEQRISEIRATQAAAKAENMESILSDLESAFIDDGIPIEDFIDHLLSKYKPSDIKGKVQKKQRSKPAIQIPEGKYNNIPPDVERVFEVSLRGPRPKLLKAHAIDIGIEAFIEQCKI